MEQMPPRQATGVPPLLGSRALVVGLGRFGGGVGVTRWLVGQGAIVTVTDSAGLESLAESVEAVADLDVSLHLGGHDLNDLSGTDLVVINPAVNKSRSELFQTVLRRGIPWTTEMNLFCERCEAAVIGVTGTYGKSTTCAMLHAALESCLQRGEVGYTRVHLGGNIGWSLLNELNDIHRRDFVVLEMSNSQLEDLPRIDWAPSLAVITNLSPHHLDRYGTYEGYVAAKLNITGGPHGTGRVVVGPLDTEAETMLMNAVPDTSRLLRVVRPDPPLELAVLGDHNQANAACVLAICQHLGLGDDAVREALSSFEGLPHRLEHVRALDGVDYYNDSKSTSPVATVKALAALKQPVVAIVGGQDKGFPLAECAAALVRSCRLVICIGESGPAYACAIRAIEGSARQSIIRSAGGIKEAVELARNEARPGDAVLLSPGAPSFDAYANFVRRGQEFTEAVNTLL